MEAWRIVLYGFAAAVALRTLAALMTAHKRRLQQEIIDREASRLEEEQQALAAAAVPRQTPRGRNAASESAA